MNRYGVHATSDEEDDQLAPLRRRQEDEQGIEDDEYWNHSQSTSATTATATATGTGTGIAFQPETTGNVGREDITNYLADLCVDPQPSH